MSALEGRARVVSAFLGRTALGVMSRDPALGLALALASRDLADALDVSTTVTPAHTLGESLKSSGHTTTGTGTA